MGQFVLMNIEMTLDPHSIQHAIDTVDDLKGKLSDALAEYARLLTEEIGVKTAQMFIAQFPAVDTGELHNSIYGLYDISAHTGTITAGAYYAAFVEYGTGIVGAKNPHPEPQGWAYDVNNHGDGGWLYPAKNGPESNAWSPDGRKAAGVALRWTRGMPARPFMYNTLRELENVVEREGGSVIARYVP